MGRYAHAPIADHYLFPTDPVHVHLRDHHLQVRELYRSILQNINWVLNVIMYYHPNYKWEIKSIVLQHTEIMESDYCILESLYPRNQSDSPGIFVFLDVLDPVAMKCCSVYQQHVIEQEKMKYIVMCKKIQYRL